MKRLLLFIAIIALGIECNAQKLETSSAYPTGYVETCYYDGNNTIKSIDGVLYMICDNTPMVLLKYPANNPRTEYEVPSTVRRIANNAFQGTRYLKTLKLHNTVTYSKFLQLVIGESAFNDSSIENFEVIENDEHSYADGVESSAYENVKREVARYQTDGRLVEEGADGIQIIRYEDGSASKVMR